MCTIERTPAPPAALSRARVAPTFVRAIASSGRRSRNSTNARFTSSSAPRTAACATGSAMSAMTGSNFEWRNSGATRSMPVTRPMSRSAHSAGSRTRASRPAAPVTTTRIGSCPCRSRQCGQHVSRDAFERFADDFRRQGPCADGTEEMRDTRVAIAANAREAFRRSAGDGQPREVEETWSCARSQQAAEAPQIVELLVARQQVFEYRRGDAEQRVVEPAKGGCGKAARERSVPQTEHADRQANDHGLRAGPCIAISANVGCDHEPWLERARENAEAAFCRPLERVGTDRGGPQRRVRTLHGPRHDVDAVEGEMTAGEAERLVARAVAQDGQRLVHEASTVRHPYAEGRILVRREAAPDAHFEAAIAKQIERRNSLGDMDRMMVRQRHDAEPEAQLRRTPRERREDQFGLRRMRVPAHEMMLDDPYAMKAAPVGQLDLVAGVGIYASLAAPDVRRHRELMEKVE